MRKSGTQQGRFNMQVLDFSILLALLTPIGKVKDHC